MKTVHLSASTLLPFVVGVILLSKVSTEEETDARAIRIVNPINHTFHLELNELKTILENDQIKDRHVAVLSVAGAFHQGKSFLLNFFIKYLNAQVK